MMFNYRNIQSCRVKSGTIEANLQDTLLSDEESGHFDAK